MVPVTGHQGPRLTETNGSGEIAERLRLRRNGTLRPLDRMLLHSPSLADGWNSFLGALRQQLALPADIRELVILRIAVLNSAQYEWDSHEGPARTSGLGESVFAALKTDHPAVHPALDERQRRVITLTDRMTREIQVPNNIFDPVRADFSEQELVELVATIAAYNMVSRFAVALNISETGEIT